MLLAPKAEEGMMLSGLLSTLSRVVVGLFNVDEKGNDSKDSKRCRLAKDAEDRTALLLDEAEGEGEMPRMLRYSCSRLHVCKGRTFSTVRPERSTKSRISTNGAFAPDAFEGALESAARVKANEQSVVATLYIQINHQFMSYKVNLLSQ